MTTIMYNESLIKFESIILTGKSVFDRFLADTSRRIFNSSWEVFFSEKLGDNNLPISYAKYRAFFVIPNGPRALPLWIIAPRNNPIKITYNLKLQYTKQIQ